MEGNMFATKKDICMFCGNYLNGECHSMLERDIAMQNGSVVKCDAFTAAEQAQASKDMVNHPNHYAGQIEVIDYIRDKLTPEGFTEYCCGNVLKYVSRWRKKDGIQDLKKARVYLDWMIQSAEKENK